MRLFRFHFPLAYFGAPFSAQVDKVSREIPKKSQAIFDETTKLFSNNSPLFFSARAPILSPTLFCQFVNPIFHFSPSHAPGNRRPARVAAPLVVPARRGGWQRLGRPTLHGCQRPLLHALACVRFLWRHTKRTPPSRCPWFHFPAYIISQVACDIL